MRETELKPCPFCGGDAIIFSAHREDIVEPLPDGSFRSGLVEFFSVNCSVCHALGYYSRNRQEAIEFWNRRADAEIDKLAELASRLKTDFTKVIEMAKGVIAEAERTSLG